METKDMSEVSTWDHHEHRTNRVILHFPPLLSIPLYVFIEHLLCTRHHVSLYRTLESKN